MVKLYLEKNLGTSVMEYCYQVFLMLTKYIAMVNIYWKFKQYKFFLIVITCIRNLSRRNLKGEIPHELNNMEALAEL